MGGFRYLFVCLPLVLLGCQSPAVLDLAKNDRLYRSPGYRAPQDGGLAVFINPLQDKRKAPDLSKSQNIIDLIPPGTWHRPVPVMIEEVLRREIEDAGIYTGISKGERGQPRAEDCVLDAELLSFYRVHETQVAAGQTGYTRMGAAVSMKISIHGPAGADGKRPLRLSKVFRQAPVTRFSLNVPDDGTSLSGRALALLVREALPQIYQSNRAQPVNASGSRDR